MSRAGIHPASPTSKLLTVFDVKWRKKLDMWRMESLWPLSGTHTLLEFSSAIVGLGVIILMFFTGQVPGRQTTDVAGHKQSLNLPGYVWGKSYRDENKRQGIGHTHNVKPHPQHLPHTTAPAVLTKCCTWQLINEVVWLGNKALFTRQRFGPNP